MNVTTWGEIDSSWIGRHVRVRWEDAGMPLAEGLPSGMPHEYRGWVAAGPGFVIAGSPNMWLVVARDNDGETSFMPPAHALVQEEDPDAAR